jgi:hypothetical protein
MESIHCKCLGCFRFSNAQLKHRLFIDASAMPTVRSIDGEVPTEAVPAALMAAPLRQPANFEGRGITMNSKLLYVATIALSLISTVALADERPGVTREVVRAELAAAAADGTLQRTDYDADRNAATGTSATTREQVYADLAAEKASRKHLVGPFRNRTYNPFGASVDAPSVLTRDEVREDVRQAAAAGMLQRTDYDDAALVARRVQAHQATHRLAQR